jgi:hypothetical protein
MNISLATPLSDGGLNSTFTYNGDVLYAAMGSDLNAGIDPSNAKYIQYFDDDDPNHRQLHVVIPPSVPTMMDMMVINKKSATTSKRDDLYKIVKKVCLDSANVEDNEFDQTYSFNNFEYILYTDPLFLTDKYIREEYFSEDNFANYELLKKIYTIGNNALIENPISDIDKSNMYWAFIMERERI